jgi:hypothetical protein
MTTYYGYRADDGEYTGVVQLSPGYLDASVTVPPNSTTIAPMTLSANQVAVWSVSAWTLQPDFRGQTWYRVTDAAPTLVTAIGDPTKLGLTSLVPPAPAQNVQVTWSGTQWVAVPDYRGQTWWDSTGTAVVINFLGDPAALRGLTNVRPPDPPIPNVDGIVLPITAAQGKIALVNAGTYDTVNAAIAASNNQAIQIYWASAPYWARTNPTLVALGAQIGLTSDQIDALFKTAATL